MAFFDNFVGEFLDNLSDSIKESRRESRENSYEWAARRTDEARAEYQFHASKANAWLDKLEEVEREHDQLDRKIQSGQYSQWDVSEWRALKSQIKRINGYIKEARKDAESARRSYEIRQEVEMKRSFNRGRSDWDFDLL